MISNSFNSCSYLGTRKSRENFQGFTLIEVLLAILILSVGLLGIGQFQSSLIRTNSLAMQRTEAVNFADSQIEIKRFTGTNLDQSLTGKNETYQSHWKTQKLSNIEVITNKISWPDRQNSHKPSNKTTVYLSTIQSTAPDDSSALWFKVANKTFVLLPNEDLHDENKSALLNKIQRMRATQ